MKVYYINLDRSDDRRKMMESSFCGQELLRISAIDGMEWAIDGEFDDRGFPVWKFECRDKLINEGMLFDNSILPPTHVACNLSHRKAIQEFLNTDDEWAIIMEDDVEPYGKLLRNGGTIEDNLIIPDGSDVFYLCGTRPDRRICVFDDGQIRKIRTLMGYCLSRKAAELFLNSTVPMMWLSDHQFPICCFESLSGIIGNGIAKDRRIVFKDKVLFKDRKDKEGNIIRNEKNNISFEMPNRHKIRSIGSILPDGIESKDKIKAFADNRYGLIRHSVLSKQSLLGHNGEHGSVFDDGRKRKVLKWI
jgi:GR25 family glycosyltransferase involved in LPS biosynthesis